MKGNFGLNNRTAGRYFYFWYYFFNTGLPKVR